MTREKPMSSAVRVLKTKVMKNKSSNRPAVKALGRMLKKRQMATNTVDDDDPPEPNLKVAKLEEPDVPEEPVTTESDQVEQCVQVEPIEPKREPVEPVVPSEPPALQETVADVQLAVITTPQNNSIPQPNSVSSPKSITKNLDSVIIDQIISQVFKFIGNTKMNSVDTISQLKNVEKSLLEEIGGQQHLLEQFYKHWNWQFAKGFNMVDRRRKNELFRGILDYGAEKDLKNGSTEHTWIEIFFSYLVKQNDKDVIWARRQAEEAMDRKQYHRYQLFLKTFGIDLPVFDERVTDELEPIYSDNEMLLPRWISLFFESLKIEHWKQIIKISWKEFELILQSLGIEIGLERTEYIYLESLVFLKICHEIQKLEVENVISKLQVDFVNVDVTTAPTPTESPKTPAWIKPLFHARYIQWRRQYEIQLQTERRLIKMPYSMRQKAPYSNPSTNLPPLNYTRVMAKLNFGFPIICQPAMAMQKLYQHMWTSEEVHYKYLRVLNEMDVIEQINIVLRPINGHTDMIPVVVKPPVIRQTEPNITLDICAYLSKILETSTLPLYATSSLSAKLPEILNLKKNVQKAQKVNENISQ